jgi:hypothetical protein
MMLDSVEIGVLVFCVAAVLAAPVWVVVRFVVPPRRVR